MKLVSYKSLKTGILNGDKKDSTREEIWAEKFTYFNMKYTNDIFFSIIFPSLFC